MEKPEFGIRKPETYDGPQGTCCKQKTIAANKKDALQTKNHRSKQKTIAKSSVWFTLGSEEETMFCDNFFRSTAGQGFQNTKWPAVRYFQ